MYSLTNAVRSSLVRSLLPLTLLGPVACGDAEPSCASGAAAGGPSNETPQCETEGVTDPTLLIDDLEDGTAFVAPVDGRSGGWWATGDDSPGATLVPERDIPALPEALPTRRCESRYAMRVTGQGFDVWGAILGVTLVYGAGGPEPYDASRHQGLTFWARIGDTSTNVVRVAFSDVNNEPEGGRCTVGASVETECHDTLGVTVTTLREEWQQYRIPFEGLSQRNFGLKADAVATEALYSIHFFFEPGAVFDFWVDDLKFY